MGRKKKGPPSRHEAIGRWPARRTWYAGELFRSQMESEWARVLDQHGFTWAYEPTRQAVGSHAYLPDFFIDELSCYVEVKPAEPTLAEFFLARLFTEWVRRPFFFFVGYPWKAEFYRSEWIEAWPGEQRVIFVPCDCPLE